MVGMHSTTDPRSIQSLDSNVMSATSSSFLQMQELSAAIYLYQSYLSSNLAFYPEPFALQSPGRPLPRTCVETHTLHQSVTGKITSSEDTTCNKKMDIASREAIRRLTWFLIASCFLPQAWSLPNSSLNGKHIRGIIQLLNTFQLNFTNTTGCPTILDNPIEKSIGREFCKFKTGFEESVAGQQADRPVLLPTKMPSAHSPPLKSQLKFSIEMQLNCAPGLP